MWGGVQRPFIGAETLLYPLRQGRTPELDESEEL